MAPTQDRAEAETRCGSTHHVCAGQRETVLVSSAVNVGNRGITAGQRIENPGAKAEFELLIAVLGVVHGISLLLVGPIVDQVSRVK